MFSRLFHSRLLPLTLLIFFAFAQDGICQRKGAVNKKPEPDTASAALPAAVTPAETGLRSSETAPQLTARPMKFDTLAGQLPAAVKAKEWPYLVVGDIEVPVDRTVSIEKGAVFLFKNFTGLHVEGKLVALGTHEQPIIFTSENDQSANPSSDMLPNPFDWNGIYIHPGAIGTSMSFCKVMYSVYGILSETKFIRLDPVTFLNNGKSNCTIEEKEQDITDAPYTYVLTVKDAMVDGVPVTILKDPLAPKRSTFRYSGLAAFLAGSAGAVYCGVQWKKYQDELDRLSTDDPMVLKDYPYGAVWTQTRNTRDANKAMTALSALIAVIGAAGFSWSFTF